MGFDPGRDLFSEHELLPFRAAIRVSKAAMTPGWVASMIRSISVAIFPSVSASVVRAASSVDSAMQPCCAQASANMAFTSANIVSDGGMASSACVNAPSRSSSRMDFRQLGQPLVKQK